MSSKMRIVSLDPDVIKIPSVRVTSFWDPDEYESFKSSLDADGQAQPIICVKEGETFWLVDGLHRLDQAKLKGWPRIQVAYKEGTLLDAKVRNLYMNRLRGKTKASEEVALIHSLTEEDHLSIDEIQKRTGLSKDVIEQRLEIGQALPEVQEALDQEQIPVGVAFQLSRLPAGPGQLKLLMALMQHIPPMPTKQVEGIVDESLRIIAERAKVQDAPQPQIPIPTFKCRLCEQKWPEEEVLGINVCHTCLGISKDYIQQLIKQRTEKKPAETILAEQIAKASSTTESPP